MTDKQKKNSKEIQKALKEIQEIISKTNLSDNKDITNTITKVYDIYKKFPKSEDIATAYAFTLGTLPEKQDSLSDVMATVAKIQGIYQKYPKSEDIATAYVYTLSDLAVEQDSLSDIMATVAKIQGIYKKFPKSDKVAYVYVLTLSNLAWKQDSLSDIMATVAKIQGIYQKYPKPEDIAFLYVRALCILGVKQDSLSDVIATVAKIQGIYQKYPKSEDIATAYVFTLGALAKKQDSLSDVMATVAKIQGIYQKYPKSEDIATAYVFTLSTLATKQNSQAEVTATVAKVSGVYEKFSDSEFVAYVYAKGLVYIESRQETTQNLPEILTEVIKIYKKSSKKEYISSLFADLISEDIIGNIFYNDNLDSLNSDIVPVIKEIFNTIIELDELKLPGYTPLIKLLKDLEDDNREQLIKIYWIVQKIKYELSIKDLSKNKFGHYTSGNVLQNLLKQSSNNEGKYSIEGRTRLGNVKYMNDPEEGSVLDKYLGISESDNLEDSLKPSPWFLMSLTTKIDNLSMWSQYGDRAEGVCLVFKTDSFKVYKSMAETEWMGKFGISILEKKLTFKKHEETNSSYQKDYLYRVCYLDEVSLKEGLSNVVTESNNNLLSEKERTIINDCLGKLKDISNEIDENTSLYSAFEECLEEIRYLFKVSGYRYESELRILKYAMLDPDNKDIKIDDKNGPVAKLYLERDMPIQLEQVIFGPKFSNPEHVVPLLHLLDKEIELKRSERKFK